MQTLDGRCLALLIPLAASNCSIVDGNQDSQNNPGFQNNADELTVAAGGHLVFSGTEFLAPGEGRTRLRFDGRFLPDQGSPETISLEVTPHYIDAQTLRWDPVGGFKVPLSNSGDQLGRFEGSITIINEHKDGTTVENDPVDFALRIAPSIIVNELAPLDELCPQPSRVLLENQRYQIAVTALGFAATDFTFEIRDRERTRTHVQPAQNGLARFGSAGELEFAPIRDDLPFDVATIVIRASNEAGDTLERTLTLGVHRPFETIAMAAELAQIEAPERTSECISADADGLNVSYTEPSPGIRSRGLKMRYRETGPFESSFEGAFAAAQARAEQRLSNDLPDAVSRYTLGRDNSSQDTESWGLESHNDQPMPVVGEDNRQVTTTGFTEILSGNILPDHTGVWFRQARRLGIPISEINYDSCGGHEVLAQGYLSDFRWNFALAQAGSCSPLPVPELPKPRCDIDCF